MTRAYDICDLRRFIQPDALKHIKQNSLVTFLKRYETYLTSRGFRFDASENDELDFETLFKILMNPTEEMDTGLVEALFFIKDMSDDEQFEELIEQVKESGIILQDEATSADLALALWMQDPESLKRQHAEVMLLKTKSFVYFRSDKRPPDIFYLPEPETIRKLEIAMDDWFLKNKRGTGCRVFPVTSESEDKTYFLVRHCMPFKRQGKVECGQSKTVFYRPESHDVLIYDRANNELALFNNPGRKKERRMYLHLFSHYLFGQENYFPEEEKYTLKPLIDNGVDALACADIEGIEDVKLVEINLQFKGPYNDEKILRSNDIFASLAARDREFPSFGRLTSAGFSVKFENAKRPRMVKLRTPNVANFDRKEDAHIVEKWLRKRGFIHAHIVRH